MSSWMSAICVFHKSFVYLRCIRSATVKHIVIVRPLNSFKIMSNNTDLETLFLEIITEERVLRLNKAIQFVFGGKMSGGAIYSENGKVVFANK